MSLHFSSAANVFTNPDFSLEERLAFRQRKREPLQNIANNIDIGKFFPPDEEKKPLVRFIEPIKHAKVMPTTPTVQQQAEEAIDWTRVVDEAMDQSSPSVRVDLSGNGLTVISSQLADLRLSTFLAGMSLVEQNMAQPKRTLGTRRAFGKAQSSPANLFGPSSTAHSDKSISSLYLSLEDNLLSAASFPLRFFELENLALLDLRNNNLKTLPASIARLTGLQELCVSGNQLTYLPAEIKSMKLTRLLYAGNCYAQPSDSSASVHPISKRLLAPLRTINRIPSLLESCQRRALQRLPTSLSRSISSRETQASIKRNIHTLSTWQADEIKSLPSHLSYPFLPLLGLSSSSMLGREEAEFDPLGNTCARCPGSVFVQHSVERLEWVYVLPGCKESAGLPILWRGCRIGCLDFLERE